ncbi:MAG: hypothetical protein NTW98_00890, partial [Candidatus Nomurabacteria bacterium]|nr:hypothetical protein [Candidatus Nomurabacteria bacterium]
MENETKFEGFYFPEFLPPPTPEEFQKNSKPTPEEFQKNSKPKTNKTPKWLVLVVKGILQSW